MGEGMWQNDAAGTTNGDDNSSVETKPGTGSENLSGTPSQGSSTDTSSGSNKQAFIDSLSANYGSKEWFRNIADKEDPLSELVKQYEHGQSQIGKMANEFRVPGDNATPEQIAAYHKAIGVPETPDAYAMPEIQWSDAEKVSGEFLKSTRVPEFEAELKQLAHKVGLTPKQWSQLAEGYDRTFVKFHGQQLDAKAAADNELSEDFSREAENLWGNKTDQVLSDVRRIVEKYAQKSAPHLNDMPNKYLLMMAETVNGLIKDLMTEDAFRKEFPEQPSADNSSREGLINQAKALMMKPEYLQNPNSKQGREIQGQIDRLFDEAAKFKQ